MIFDNFDCFSSKKIPCGHGKLFCMKIMLFYIFKLFGSKKSPCGHGRTFCLSWKNIALGGMVKRVLELHSGGGSVMHSAINALSALGSPPRPSALFNALEMGGDPPPLEEGGFQHCHLICF